MDLQLTGKTAIITGAGRGIGLATARALAAEGVTVVGASRTITRELEEVATRAVGLDLTRPESAGELVEAATDLGGGIDILVNNVGAGDPEELNLSGFLEADDAQWTSLMTRNLYATVWMARAALPHLLRSSGAMVNISSVNARIPATGPVGYSEAKAALTAFGKRLSEEFGPQGVRVNTVSPGPVATGLWRDPDGFGARVAQTFGATHAEFLAAMPQTFGLTTGRLAEPEEVAALVTFLASPQAASIAGSDVAIDSGASKQA